MILVLLSVSDGARAAPPAPESYSLRQWSIRDGLPQTTVTGIALGGDGLLWVSTFGGIASFDGTRFRVFDPGGHPALAGNRFIGAATAPDGSLWFRAEGGGLVHIVDGHVRGVPTPAPNFDALGMGPLFDRDGHMWTATLGGLYEGDERGVSLVPGTQGLVGEQMSISLDDEGLLWLIGDRGVACWSQECPDRGVVVEPDIRRLATLARGERGRPLDIGDIVRSALGAREQWVKLVRWQGRIWLLERDGVRSGPRFVNLQADEVVGPDVAMPGIFVASDSSLWVGGFGLGLSNVQDRGLSLFGEAQGLAAPEVWGLAEDARGRLWVSDGHALRWIVDGRVQDPPAAMRDLGHMRGLVAWRDGVVLVTDDAAWYLTDSVTPFPLGVPPSSVDALTTLADGSLWIGGDAVYRHDGAKPKVELPVGGIDGQVQVIREGPDGAVWVGATAEVVRLEGELVRRFGVMDGLSGTVRDIWFDPEGRAWLGTYGGGLYAVLDGRLRRFGASDGLCENVYSRLIADDQGALWANGNRGLSRIEVRALLEAAEGDPLGLRCDLFPSGEGNGRAGLRASDGALWFPTTNGVARVLPEKVETPAAPRISVSSIQVDGVPIPDGGEAHPGRGELLVTYNAIEPRFDDAIQFRRRLVGHDEVWSLSATEREARFVNLPPGAYRFEVQARGPRGPWSAVASQSVTLLPNFWERAWFRALAVGGLLAFVGGVIWMRFIAINRRAALRRAAETERQREALAISEARLRLILESSADGILGVGRDGHLTFANSAANEMLGRSNPVVGRTFDSVVATPLPGGMPVELSAAIRDGRSARLEDLCFSRADGTDFPVSVAVEPLWQGSELVGAVVSFRDMSTQRAAEQARLAGAEAAERLARVRSEFVANMSHEIRTPLSGVLGLSQLGLRHTDDPRARRTFQRILEAGRHLLEVVDDVLDFSKLEAGRLQVEVGTVRLGPVIDRAVEFVSLDATERGLRLLVEEAPDLPSSFAGDEVRVAQVLVNLMSNAVKFTPSGTVALRVRRVPEPVDTLVIEVEDTGIGIAMAEQERVFRAFVQADSSASRRSGGTGLGLAISRALVLKMGGQIRVRSVLGQGTCFEVRVPLQSVVEATPAFGSVALIMAPLGVEASLVARGVRIAEPVDADLLVVPEATLRDLSLREVIAARQEAGLPVAVVERPGGDAAATSLRERMIILNAPLRARHVLEALAPGAAPEGGRPRLSGVRVLVAEDLEVNWIVLEDLLTAEGAEPTCAVDGVSAVSAVAAGPSAFDVVLMDVQMPEMDGYEATRRIGLLAPGLPVIGVTAHATPEERARCKEAGMVAHLSKPYLPEDLVAVIQRHVSARSTLPGAEIDRAAIETRYPGGAAFARRLLALVASSNRDVPVRLRAAVAERQHAVVAHLAHGIKGTAGNVCAFGLAQAADEVQLSARAGSDSCFAAAERLASRVETLLEEAGRG